MNALHAHRTWALVLLAVVACGPEQPAQRTRPHGQSDAPPATAPQLRAPSAGALAAECPARMVALPDLHACIDRHEALIRDGSAEPADGVLPTRKASFDEAQHTCETAGYRLCTEREWTRACQGPGTPRKFPYGDVYDAERCNTASRTATDAAPLPGGSHPRCVTPEGVYDLSGNVWEWTSGADRSGTLRELRGGGFGNGADDDLVACIPEDHAFQPRDASFDGYGLRCCTSTR